MAYQFLDEDGNEVVLCRKCGSMVSDGKCLNCGALHEDNANAKEAAP